MLADVIYEQIVEVQGRQAALEAELDALFEMHEIARTRLNGEGASGPATTVTQPPAADPPSRRAPAPRPPRKTSTRRSPDAPNRPASRGGVPASGDGAPHPVALRERVQAAFRQLGAATPTRVGLHLGFGKSTVGMGMVRAIVREYADGGVLVKDGAVRGHPAYRLADHRESGGSSTAHAPRPAPETLRAPASVPIHEQNPVDRLLDQLVAYLLENGPRQRDDLKAELGDPFEEEFRLALDRGVTLKRIQKVTQQGGRVVYRGSDHVKPLRSMAAHTKEAPQ